MSGVYKLPPRMLGVRGKNLLEHSYEFLARTSREPTLNTTFGSGGGSHDTTPTRPIIGMSIWPSTSYIMTRLRFLQSGGKTQLNVTTVARPITLASAQVGTNLHLNRQRRTIYHMLAASERHLHSAVLSNGPLDSTHHALLNCHRINGHATVDTLVGHHQPMRADASPVHMGGLRNRAVPSAERKQEHTAPQHLMTTMHFGGGPQRNDASSHTSKWSCTFHSLKFFLTSRGCACNPTSRHAQQWCQPCECSA